MQKGFFGSSHPSGLLVPWGTKRIIMTATTITYTPFGFALAADGRQRWGHEPTRNEAVRQSENDYIQKIFEVHAGNHNLLAYMIRGDVANADRSFDLGMELEKQAALHKRSKFAGLLELVQAISADLKNYIEGAKEGHRIQDYPATFIDFIGYFDGLPSWIELQLLRVRNPVT
jgi:hypothetical protein